MMMKRISLVAALFFLAACSSDGTKNEQTSSKTSSDTSLDGPATTSSAATEVSEPVAKEKVKAAPAAPSQYDSLKEAIRNQSDEQVYTAATQILIQSPTDMKALNAMAMYNYKKSRFEVARFLLEKAIATYPNASELQSNLGLVLLAQNERREAVKAFRKALELNSSDAVASANLGAIYVSERDYNKARIVLETAYTKGMRDPKVLNNYGIALAASQKFDQADEMYKMVLKSQSDNKEAMLNDAIVLIDNLAKYQEGLELVSRLKFVGVSSESRSRINALENKAKAGVK